jgi:hypothetical protein
MFRGRRSIAVTLAVGAVAAAAVASVASGGPTAAGYNTTQAAMVSFVTNPLSGAPPGSTADAFISVGDTIGGYTFESIPDGVSVYPRGNGRVDVYVNHETSTVPFPYNPPFGGATPLALEANQNDFTNSEVSLLEMKPHKAEINKASKAIASAQNMQRFCASFLATAAEGFKHPILFANEEAQDWVFRSGTAWPGPTSITPGTAGAEQAGVVYGHDVKSGKTKPIYGMGRHNHESAVAIPGFDEIVVLSGDDTFQTNAPASSQLYMYTASDSDELWDDAGTLHAFVADGAPGTDDEYFELQPGETISGNFLPVPDHIAKGKDPVDGHELTRAVDFPSYPAPSGGPSVPPDGPQWILDQWGNTSNSPSVPDTGNNVFDFIRLEDIAYDKNDTNVVYIADSGRATAGAANQLTTSTNGRIYRLELDPNGTGDPTEAEISILVQGDDSPTGGLGVPALSVASLNEIHQPDNLETTVNGNLLVTEDPSSASQYDAGSLNSTPARLWMVPLNNPEAGKKPLLSVSQALDENANPALGKVDVDAAAAARLGAWESSGIVDASAAFGPGTFFLTIQAHSYWIDKLAGPDLLGAAGTPPGGNGADFFYKKEGGQLILLTMPGI